MSLQDLGVRELTLLRLYTSCQLRMSPQDFYAKWNVTHAQMARICGCSEPTVNRWFSQGRGSRSPEAIHLRRLAEMNLLWEFYEEIPGELWERFCPPQH
jgi:uncharacterized membrane protein